MVQAMTHDDWMKRYGELHARLMAVSAKLDELVRHSSYLPGPVLVRRQRELEAERNQLDALMRELVDLDRVGAVS